MIKITHLPEINKYKRRNSYLHKKSWQLRTKLCYHDVVFKCNDELGAYVSIKKKTDLIIAANAICHIPQLNDLIKGVDNLLNKTGLFIFEEPYLGSMFEKTSYDQIYDEHIFMFSATSVKKIFNLHNFELINIVPQKTHGGSMRYVIARKSIYKIKKNVSKQLDYENRNNINSIKGCLKFKKN